jgi:hypothetical protein
MSHSPVELDWSAAPEAAASPSAQAEKRKMVPSSTWLRLLAYSSQGGADAHLMDAKRHKSEPLDGCAGDFFGHGEGLLYLQGCHTENV